MNIQSCLLYICRLWVVCRSGFYQKFLLSSVNSSRWAKRHKKIAGLLLRAPLVLYAPVHERTLLIPTKGSWGSGSPKSLYFLNRFPTRRRHNSTISAGYNNVLKSTFSERRSTKVVIRSGARRGASSTTGLTQKVLPDSENKLGEIFGENMLLI